ncbi:MAG: tol-pal system-associated acyl-CoA thioesterase [Mariprofundaceae bacterium]|nr:tol-pal system-associated acyl-CoA thioesterase [Mariprofundaceae bacterium]
MRVYYEDTDSGGVVYYANYLKFMERARTEMLRECDLDIAQLHEKQDIIFAVSEANIRYHLPAKLNDLLEVQTQLIRMRGARLFFSQSVWRDQHCLVSGSIVIACINHQGKPQRIPAFVQTAIKALKE